MKTALNEVKCFGRLFQQLTKSTPQGQWRKERSRDKEFQGCLESWHGFLERRVHVETWPICSVRRRQTGMNLLLTSSCGWEQKCLTCWTPLSLVEEREQSGSAWKGKGFKAHLQQSVFLKCYDYLSPSQRRTFGWRSHSGSLVIVSTSRSCRCGAWPF